MRRSKNQPQLDARKGSATIKMTATNNGHNGSQPQGDTASMLEVMEDKDVYVSEFNRFEKAQVKVSPASLHRIRQAGFACFTELGFPTSRDEEWRFTPLASIIKTPFRRDIRQIELAPELIAPFQLDGAIRVVLVNGRYSKSLSSLAGLPKGVVVAPLASALETEGKQIEEHLARHAEYKEHPFVALNTAFIEDGVYVRIPKGMTVDAPIQLLYVSSNSNAVDGPLVSHPRNLIVVEENSRATILESYAGIGKGAYFTNAVTELIVGRNSNVEHYKAQQESLDASHVATVQILQEKDSTFFSTSVSLGGTLTRNNINAVLNAEGIECTLDGLYIADDDQLVDNHTFIDHAKPHCNSHELYKGILGGRARGVFNGKILVRQDAQKTDAKQTNKALLISEDAQINTQPMLKIFADDVKCTHGATIGQLDKDQMFYLRSRGIGEGEAKGILTFAFANDIVSKIKNTAIQQHFERVLSDLLKRPMGLALADSAI